jgi:hypothetical protein
MASMAVMMKLYALRQESNYLLVYIVFLILYLSRYFTLFEMTVLRGTMSMSLAFYLFARLSEYKFKINHIVYLLLATSLHYSAVIFFVVYLVGGESLKRIFLAAAAMFLLIYFGKGLAIEMLPLYITVFSTYDEFSAASTLPVPLVLDIILLMIMILYWRSGDYQMRISTFGLLLSLVMHFSLLEFSMIAARFRELLSVFILIYCVRSMKFSTSYLLKVIIIMFVFLSGIINLYVNYFHDPLLT